MNLACVDPIAKAVLYEGYMLYPYRPSSVKNRQRWNFGVVYPPALGGKRDDEQDDQGPSRIQAECLVCGKAPALDIRLRFLQLRTRLPRLSAARLPESPDAWQEAIEREISLTESDLSSLCAARKERAFEFSAHSEEDSQYERRHEAIAGHIVIYAEKICSERISTENIPDDLFKIAVSAANITPLQAPPASRDAALMQSFVSAHIVLGVEHGEFVSLLEPPRELQETVARCQNIGVWPVLVGEAGQRNTMLASPIILYDYPQIAPESMGDLFDGTEIDEILSLRIMTLTDEEKREIRNSDSRARQILERTEAIPPEQFMKLHGTLRGLRPLPEEER